MLPLELTWYWNELTGPIKWKLTRVDEVWVVLGYIVLYIMLTYAHSDTDKG